MKFEYGELIGGSVNPSDISSARSSLRHDARDLMMISSVVLRISMRFWEFIVVNGWFS